MSKRNFQIYFDRKNDRSIDYLLGILEDVRATTLQALKNISNQELDWQCKKGWNTIGALLSHISALEHYFRIEYIEERKLTEEENQKWLPALDMGEYLPQLICNRSIGDYVAEFTESRRMLMQALTGMSFDRFSRRMEGYDSDTGCNLAWVLFHMAEDEIYHRGQISILRKLYKETITLRD